MMKESFSDLSQNVIERLNARSFSRRTLSNGLVALHTPDFSSSVVSVQVWVKTGSIHEGAYLGSGLSHFLEHMLFKGTSKREGKRIAEEVQMLGGQINAYTTFDRTVYYINAPAESFEVIVEILSDIIFNSTLPADELEVERKVILREIEMGNDDPDRQLTQALFQTAFKKHPYREPVIGHRSLFESISHEVLSEYYKSRYIPNNIVVCSAGAVLEDDCISTVERYFGASNRRCVSSTWIENEPTQLAERFEASIAPFNIHRGTIAYKIPNLSHPDSPALNVLASVFGQGESSRLWKRIRNELKLVQYISCHIWNPGEQGLLSISYICEPKFQSEVIAAIDFEFEALLRDGITEQELEKAQRQALSSEINSRKTINGQATRLGLGEVVIGEANYMGRYLKRLQSLDVDTIQSTALKYISETRRSVVSLGPRVEDSVDSEGSLASTVTERPSPEVHTLKSGARLVLEQDSSLPKVHLRAVFLGGCLYEDADKRGASNLLAELLTKDTEKEDGASISARIEALGGSFASSGGNNTLSLAIEVLPQDFPVAFELLSNALTVPAFNADTFETERSAQIADIQETMDDILSVGFRRLRELFFKTYPMSVAASGRIEDLELLRIEDLKALFDRLVTASNCVLSVCGDFNKETVLDASTELLDASISQNSEAVDATKHTTESGAIIEHHVMEREQAVVLLGFPDVGVKDKDFVTAELLCELLNGLSSNLFDQVREKKGLAYYVGATRVIGTETSMFAMYAGTQPEQTPEVIHEMKREIARLASGKVETAELERCRATIKAARVMGRQTIGARAMHSALNLSYNLPVNDDAEHNAKLDACGASEIASFVSHYLCADKCVELTVGPENS